MIGERFKVGFVTLTDNDISGLTLTGMCQLH